MDGKLEVYGINGGTSYLNDNNAEYLSSLLQKVTGHKITCLEVVIAGPDESHSLLNR